MFLPEKRVPSREDGARAAGLVMELRDRSGISRTKRERIDEFFA